MNIAEGLINTESNNHSMTKLMEAISQGAWQDTQDEQVSNLNLRNLI